MSFGCSLYSLQSFAIATSAEQGARLRGKPIAFMTAYETFRAEHDLESDGVDPSWARHLRQKDG